VGACSYDLLKSSLYSSGKVEESVPANLLVGATAGTIATTVCYPLDTVRRRMQVPAWAGRPTPLLPTPLHPTLFRVSGGLGFRV